MANVLTDVDGLHLRGFVDPVDLPMVMAKASCFVIASDFEPWCVALHEATSAGLPLISSNACGAAVHMLQDGYNGFLISPNSPDELAIAMDRLTRQSDLGLQTMANRSRDLSRQFTPARWSETVLANTVEMQRLRRL